VILHVRKSQDQILKRLRQTKVSGGIAHAFNGSFVQAQQFLDLNFKLGFGGTLTFERALQIRRLACDLPLDAFVLETDAPDIPPAWLKEECESRNEPANLPRIAQEFVKLRNLEAEFVSQQALQNALAVLPRWQSLIQANPIA
jgi:TatD DNase family protein